MRRATRPSFSTLLLRKSIQFLTLNSALLSSYIMVMKTVAGTPVAEYIGARIAGRGREKGTREIDPDLSLIKKEKREGVRETRNKFYQVCAIKATLARARALTSSAPCGIQSRTIGGSS